MQKIKHILLITTLILAFTSCATSKIATKQKNTLAQRAQVELTLDQHQFQANCLIKIWKNELIVLSVVPLGIEMFRVEATPQQVMIIDKMNKKYAIISYQEISQMAPVKVSYKLLQTAVINKKKQLEFKFNTSSHNIHLNATITKREKNTLKEPNTINTSKYKQVKLREILPI
jgi:hypothetical protein